jgi:hypothetical protein
VRLKRRRKYAENILNKKRKTMKSDRLKKKREYPVMAKYNTATGLKVA